jgi:hypothetical protein
VGFVTTGKPVPSHAEHFCSTGFSACFIDPPEGIARVTQYKVRSFDNTADLPINAILTTQVQASFDLLAFKPKPSLSQPGGGFFVTGF